MERQIIISSPEYCEEGQCDVVVNVYDDAEKEVACNKKKDCPLGYCLYEQNY